MKNAFLLLLAAIPLLAADTETATLVNGRGWAGMNDSSKAFYVRGVYDCAMAPFTVNLKEPGGLDIGILIDMAGTTFGEMAKAVDGFYSDSLNMRIPVIWALMWVKSKHDGASPEILERYAANLRAKFNSQYEPVKPTPLK
jgi:hypothetical protein